MNTSVVFTVECPMDAISEIFEAFIQVNMRPCPPPVGAATAVYHCKLNHVVGVSNTLETRSVASYETFISQTSFLQEEEGRLTVGSFETLIHIGLGIDFLSVFSGFFKLLMSDRYWQQVILTTTRSVVVNDWATYYALCFCSRTWRDKHIVIQYELCGLLVIVSISLKVITKVAVCPKQAHEQSFRPSLQPNVINPTTTAHWRLPVCL